MFCCGLFLNIWLNFVSFEWIEHEVCLQLRTKIRTQKKKWNRTRPSWTALMTNRRATDLQLKAVISVVFLIISGKVINISSVRVLYCLSDTDFFILVYFHISKLFRYLPIIWTFLFFRIEYLFLRIGYHYQGCRLSLPQKPLNVSLQTVMLAKNVHNILTDLFSRENDTCGRGCMFFP